MWTPTYGEYAKAAGLSTERSIHSLADFIQVRLSVVQVWRSHSGASWRLRSASLSILCEIYDLPLYRD